MEEYWAKTTQEVLQGAKASVVEQSAESVLVRRSCCSERRGPGAREIGVQGIGWWFVRMLRRRGVDARGGELPGRRTVDVSGRRDWEAPAGNVRGAMARRYRGRVGGLLLGRRSWALTLTTACSFIHSFNMAAVRVGLGLHLAATNLWAACTARRLDTRTTPQKHHTGSTIVRHRTVWRALPRVCPLLLKLQSISHASPCGKPAPNAAPRRPPR